MKHLLCPILLITAHVAAAQSDYAAATDIASLEASVASDIQALNAHFTGVARFRVDKRDQLVTEYLANGNTYRTDIAYLEFLDATTCSFNAEENTVMLQCQDPRSKCIQKEVKKSGAISPTGRMNLPLPAGDAQGERAIQLLSKLVEHKQNAQLQRLAETNTRDGR